MAEREPLSEKLREAVLQAHDQTCQYCLNAEAAEVDHIVPVSKNGTNDYGNLIAACYSCNRRKRAGQINERYLALISAVADEKRRSVERLFQAKLGVGRPKSKFITLADHFRMEWRIVWMPAKPEQHHVDRLERAFRDLAQVSVEHWNAAEDLLGGLTPKGEEKRAQIKSALDKEHARKHTPAPHA